MVTQMSTEAAGEPLPDRLTALAVLVVHDLEGDVARCAPGGVAP